MICSSYVQAREHTTHETSSNTQQQSGLRAFLRQPTSHSLKEMLQQQRPLITYLLKLGFSVAFVLWLLNKMAAKDAYGRILLNEVITTIRNNNFSLINRLYAYWLIYIKVPWNYYKGSVPVSPLPSSEEFFNKVNRIQPW